MKTHYLLVTVFCCIIVSCFLLLFGLLHLCPAHEVGTRAICILENYVFKLLLHALMVKWKRQKKSTKDMNRFD